MKHSILQKSLITAILLTLSGLLPAQPICTFKVEEPDLAFKEHEKLTYVVTYTWGLFNTDVGEADFEIYKIRDFPIEYRIVINAKTYKFYDKFFMVRDYYEARFSIPDLRSLYFYRNISEGGYLVQNTYNFDWENNKIDATVKVNQRPEKKIEMPMENCTLDVLTYFYYLRNLNFDDAYPGKAYSLSIALDTDIYNIKCRFIGKEKKKIKAMKRKVDCLKFAVEVIAGSVFKGDESVTLWVSDDKNHIPLEIESPITVGKVKARITKYDNLKYPIP